MYLNSGSLRTAIEVARRRRAEPPHASHTPPSQLLNIQPPLHQGRAVIVVIAVPVWELEQTGGFNKNAKKQRRGRNETINPRRKGAAIVTWVWGSRLGHRCCSCVGLGFEVRCIGSGVWDVGVRAYQGAAFGCPFAIRHQSSTSRPLVAQTGVVTWDLCAGMRIGM